jgi:hypothetical protein
MYVSWTQPANAKATVGYFPGGYPADAAQFFDMYEANIGTTSTNVIYGDYLFSKTGAGYLYPRNAAYATFPVIGGKGTIAIQTSYFASGNFYAEDKPATLDITFDQYDLDLHWWDYEDTSSPPDRIIPPLKAMYIHDTATTGKVNLSWPRIKGDEDVYSDVPYEAKSVTYNVWKREISLNQDSLGQVTGDWVKVNYTLVEPGDGHTTNHIYAVEDGVNSFLGNWEYIVYASAAKGGKTSHSSLLKATLVRTLPTEAAISVAAAYGYYDGQVYTARITVSDLKAGVSYKLYRGEITPILTNTRYGRWVSPAEINGNTGDGKDGYQFTGYAQGAIQEWTGQLVLGDTTAAIYDNGIAPRKSYIYKLVSSIGETLLGDGAVASLVATSTYYPASVYSNLSLTVNSLTSSSATDNKIGYIDASVSNNGYTVGMDVKLYYRRAETTGTTPPGTLITEWKPLHTFEKYSAINGDASQSTDRTGVFKPVVLPIPDAVFGGEQYQFKAVASINGVDIPNLSKSNYYDTFDSSSPPVPIPAATITDGARSVAVSTPSITSGLSSSSLGFASPADQIITGIKGDFLNGATINVRIVSSLSGGGRQKYWVQPKNFTIHRIPTFDPNDPQYQVTINLENVPAAIATVADRKSYTVQYKYPWEKWEAISDADHVIQDHIRY